MKKTKYGNPPRWKCEKFNVGDVAPKMSVYSFPNRSVVWDRRIGMVLKEPRRSFRMAIRYWWPKRLTLNLPGRPRIHAWLWWNF